MIRAGHYDASYLNESKARGRYKVHIFLSEDEPVPKLNGPILTIDQIMISVMSSAAKAELTGLYISSK